MAKRTTLSGVLILIVSVTLGCSDSRKADYRPLELAERQDPLASDRNFVPWHPPRQMAAFVHPHEDVDQGIVITGHWIMVLLGEGSWYFQEDWDQEPVPDAETTAEDVRKALGAVSVPRDAVIPYRPKEGGKQ